jgi:Ser/Thr protein kinase RdoA (MazF antagonist)
MPPVPVRPIGGSGTGAPVGVAVSGWAGSDGSGGPAGDSAEPSTLLTLASSSSLLLPEASRSATSPPGAACAAPHRSRFSAGELAVVCSHYDLGVIESVKEFKRGSSRAPKVVLKSSQGFYLLKRRARGKDEPQRVAFSHALQLHLTERRFPLPRLIGTRGENNSMLQVDGRVYELFEYVPSSGYDGSLEATGDAGRALAIFHKMLAGYRPSWTPPPVTYHNAASLAGRLGEIPPRLAGAESVVDTLGNIYTRAAARVEALGIGDWPRQIIHGDWHPGNMLFKGPRVSAVLDFDAARPAPRVIDIANGALQFSITMEGGDPERWPDALDEGRLKRFCRGYDQVPGSVISSAELQALPWLMIEALIVEAAIPIAATGSFARMDGLSFLRMIERKVGWLAGHAERLVSLVAD